MQLQQQLAPDQSKKSQKSSKAGLQLPGSLEHRQSELAKDTGILCHRKSKREEIKLLRLPRLLDGIVVVEVVEADGVCRMPVCWPPWWEFFFLLVCPPSWHRKFCLRNIVSYWLHVDNYELILWRSLIKEMIKKRKSILAYNENEIYFASL